MDSNFNIIRSSSILKWQTKYPVVVLDILSPTIYSAELVEIRMLISQFGFTNRINSLCHRINGANLKPIKQDHLSAEAKLFLTFTLTAFWTPQ